MKKLSVLLMVLLCLLGSCNKKGGNTDSEYAATNPRDSILVLYYSQTGATRQIAEELQRQLGCDIAEIKVVNPYDGDYDATIKRWQEELQSGHNPEIVVPDIDYKKYHTIFLGSPIWGGTYSLPIAEYVSGTDLSGLNIVTFATFGSGGIDNMTKDIKERHPGANVTRGYGVRNARLAKAPAEIHRFLVEKGYAGGDIDVLPDFDESLPLTEKDKKIFDAACGDYPYPLGTPVKVAIRQYDNITEYRYEVESESEEYGEQEAFVYVKKEDKTPPIFTEVVRL